MNCVHSEAGELPLLDRRGGCATWKMMRSFQTRADGVVVQETSPEQPPRRFAPPLLSRRGHYVLPDIAPTATAPVQSSAPLPLPHPSADTATHPAPALH